jgi:hypothetical protein
MNTINILSLFLLCISHVNATAFTVVYKRSKGDNHVINMDSASITCDGSSYCTWGSEAQVTGQFTIYSDLTSPTADVITRGFGFRNKTHDELDICDYVDSSLSGTECPAAGTYTFSTQVTFPSDIKESWYNVFVENTFGKYEVKFTFQDEGIWVKFIFRLFTENSRRNRNRVSAGAILAVGVAAAFGYKKRRRIVTDPQHLLDDGEASSNFEMMNSQQGHVSTLA